MIDILAEMERALRGEPLPEGGATVPPAPIPARGVRPAVRPAPVASAPVDEDHTPVRGAQLARVLALRVEMTADLDINGARMPWPDDWFGTADAADVSACVRLWKHILAENIREALEHARKWDGRLSSWIGGTEYGTVCALAGWDEGMAETVALRLVDVARDPALRAVAIQSFGGSHFSGKRKTA